MSGLGSGAMFDAIAPRYDLLNRLASFGADQRWRRRAARALGVGAGDRVLDVATGTADLALAIARTGASVVGVDPSRHMLAIGARKAAAARADISFVAGDALDLAFPDASFAGAGVAFGIRNVTDRPRALAELARVVRPGGRVVVLELAEPRSPFARFHVHAIVPWLGARLSRARAYRYLQESIARFPPAEEFAATIAAAGLEVETVAPMTFGAVTLFVARRPGAGPAPRRGEPEGRS
jgi:demethylmenaquinone methyltransferase/2-methoxy-6-polyprenyl-1,4-benzoquinol methylase